MPANNPVAAVAMPPVIFLDAAILLDAERPLHVIGGGQVVDLSAAHAIGPARSAPALNRLVHETGGTIVISSTWGLDTRDQLRARGIAAEFHHDRLDTRELGSVGLTGPWLIGGEGADPATAQVGISMRREEQPSPIKRWLSNHGNPPAVVIDRPGSRPGVPGAIVVTVERGHHITDTTVDGILALLAQG